MIYDDWMQKLLESKLEKTFENINEFDRSWIKHINNLYLENLKIISKKLDKKGNRLIEKIECIPILELKIFDGKVTMNNKISKHEKHVSIFQKMFTNAVEWAKSNGLSVPNTYIYIYISDKVCWYGENTQHKLPLLHYVCTSTNVYPLIPDTTFTSFWIDNKYSDKEISWDETKTLISHYTPEKKKDIMYFKGAPTGAGRTNLRMLTENRIKKRDRVIIDLTSNKNFDPIYKFADYSILLNLPEHGDWSNRFKYLFLMKSITVNINVITNIDLSLQPEFTKYEKSINLTFIDLVMDPNIDYINIDYNYYGPRKFCNNVTRYDELTNKEVNKMLIQLNMIYEDIVKNKKKYEPMIDRGFKKINMLNEDRINQYLFKCITLTHELIGDKPLIS